VPNDPIRKEQMPEVSGERTLEDAIPETAIKLFFKKS
jgi:hypothetical protein